MGLSMITFDRDIGQAWLGECAGRILRSGRHPRPKQHSNVQGMARTRLARPAAGSVACEFLRKPA